MEKMFSLFLTSKWAKQVLKRTAFDKYKGFSAQRKYILEYFLFQNKKREQTPEE
jgi:hypothetical protein